jgi:hypothetical protein
LGRVPPPTPKAQENDMRIIRLSDLSALVLVKGRGVFTVAIPERLTSDEVLELASLVLSTSEYEEFLHSVDLLDDPAHSASVGHRESP